MALTVVPATAATSLPKNSVKSKTIKDGQVKTKDVKDNGLTGADIDEATLSLPSSGGGGAASDLNWSGCVVGAEGADAAVTLARARLRPRHPGRAQLTCDRRRQPTERRARPMTGASRLPLPAATARLPGGESAPIIG